MIQINDDDLPITVAEKIIKGVKEVHADVFTRAFCKGITGQDCGETIKADIFDDDDIREIADHLYAYLREKRVEEE